ncbi:hypothetical protein MHK_007807 [Candidatus Magnetomorum sp. HK-1]|nr:hypothetical protein MHK_007807 [Candidatus Magnetomorum sp. HK-1]
MNWHCWGYRKKRKRNIINNKIQYKNITIQLNLLVYPIDMKGINNCSSFCLNQNFQTLRINRIKIRFLNATLFLIFFQFLQKKLYNPIQSFL